MKKGFTLIEMIGSIVILAIIALVAFPAVLNMLNSSQGKVDKGMQDYAIGAAKEYVEDHVNSFPRTAIDNTGKVINVSTLVNEGYISEKSLDKSMITSGKVRVYVKKPGSVFIYEYKYE